VLPRIISVMKVFNRTLQQYLGDIKTIIVVEAELTVIEKVTEARRAEKLPYYNINITISENTFTRAINTVVEEIEVDDKIVATVKTKGLLLPTVIIAKTAKTAKIEIVPYSKAVISTKV